MATHKSILAPSILAGNHANLAESLSIIAASGVSWIHLDIMDGHFVPNLTFGPKTVKNLREISDLYFDTHLMLDNPQNFIEAFVDAGSNNITIPVEPNYDIEKTLNKIRQLGCQCGLSLNPATSVDAIFPYIDKVDLILVMTVVPGYGGQSFHENVVPKIGIINKWRKEHKLNFRLEVDGGINPISGKFCKLEGADTFVAGSAFFEAKDKKAFLNDLCS